MEELKLVWLIIKRTHADKFIYSFAVYYVLFCFLIQLADPSIENFGDALWFGFNVITSIGLGDYTVTSLFGRLLTVLLGIYGALMMAFIPGLVSSYYMEKVNMTKNETLEQYYDQLAHADTLTDQEKKTIARNIKGGNKHV